MPVACLTSNILASRKCGFTAFRRSHNARLFERAACSSASSGFVFQLCVKAELRTRGPRALAFQDCARYSFRQNGDLYTAFRRNDSPTRSPDRATSLRRDGESNVCRRTDCQSVLLNRCALDGVSCRGVTFGKTSTTREFKNA